MKILQIFGVAAVLVAIIGGGVYFFGSKIPKGQASGVLGAMQSLADSVITKKSSNSSGQSMTNSSDKNGVLAQLGSVAGTALSQAESRVLGASTSSASIQASQSSSIAGSSPQAQFLEQARYQYCQQVVKDYEGRYGTDK